PSPLPAESLRASGLSVSGGRIRGGEDWPCSKYTSPSSRMYHRPFDDRPHRIAAFRRTFCNLMVSPTHTAPGSVLPPPTPPPRPGNGHRSAGAGRRWGRQGWGQEQRKSRWLLLHFLGETVVFARGAIMDALRIDIIHSSPVFEMKRWLAQRNHPLQLLLDGA